MRPACAAHTFWFGRRAPALDAQIAPYAPPDRDETPETDRSVQQNARQGDVGGHAVGDKDGSEAAFDHAQPARRDRDAGAHLGEGVGDEDAVPRDAAVHGPDAGDEAAAVLDPVEGGEAEGFEPGSLARPNREQPRPRALDQRVDLLAVRELVDDALGQGTELADGGEVLGGDDTS